MSYTIIILLGLLLIAPIFLAYYYDYKADPKEFSFSVKTLGKGLGKGIIYIAIYFGINKAYELLVPLNKNHGMEFNSEREQLGIPTLKSDWKVSDYESEQFTTYWWKPEPTNGHFKKIIEYGILDSKSETDYYQNEDKKGTFAWSKYDFDKREFQYFMELPNEKLVSVTDRGQLRVEKPTVVKNVSKSEFENYITE
ncbi:hypothetical protein KO500_08220 [Cellulophaga baltica]|uniref:hypothetical protein n=1 Tax=Cellulophaga TaxID=104264 RepID=UPI001C0722D1|nr:MULTISPECIES: hypothetical protein [Cellulophaga]MBU2996417.1 hypothetical protein [Cellulophaga baltica]MDO6767813.1 hypothetical protein [Cellulophaga sp. 1_MG-2023]